MARGEPLLNPVIMKHYKQLFDIISTNVKVFTGIDEVKFNISTIIPKDVNKEDLKNFNDPRAEIYYSLYSTDENFRKRWLPKAMDVRSAIGLLKSQDNLTIHYALIKGENDSLEEAEKVVNVCAFLDSNIKLNIVQYNPFSPGQGTESDSETIRKYIEYMDYQDFFYRIKIIERVGHDVKASCGMFFEQPINITRLSNKT
jgi:adenine C2-methylase RlmN of 23S rRNA A2503 and tRNA A37